MANGRHSYVAFYPSDWRAGVGHLTRMHRSVFFDVCCHIWDRAEPCPATRLPLILGDLKHWQRYVDELVADGKLTRLEDGSLTNDRAMAEAVKSRDLHAKKSAGGRKGADKTNAGSADGTPGGSVGAEKGTPAAEPEPEPDKSSEADASGGEPPDPAAIIFGAGLKVLTAAGVAEREGRSMLGKWRGQHGDEALIAALGMAKREGALAPIEFIQGIFRSKGNGRSYGQSASGLGRTVDAVQLALQRAGCDSAANR